MVEHAVILPQRDLSTLGLTRQAGRAGTGGEGVTLDQPPTPGRPSNRRVKWDAKRTKITQNVMNKGREEHKRIENK